MIKNILIKNIETITFVELRENETFKIRDKIKTNFFGFKKRKIGEIVTYFDFPHYIEYTFKEFEKIYGERYKIIKNKIYKKPYVKINLLSNETIIKFFDSDIEAENFYRDIIAQIENGNKLIELTL